MSQKTIYVVTGANKGIGKAIVSVLAQRVKQSSLIYLAARDETRGMQAVKELSNISTTSEIRYLPLDISDENSIQMAVSKTRKEVGYIDVLINNAGIAAKGSVFDGTIAASTLATNYSGTKNTCLQFLPLLRQNGRIVNVSSSLGKLNILSPELQAKFTLPTLGLKELDDLMKDFVENVKDGSYEKKGWPKQAYAVSKIGVTALTSVLSRLADFKAKNIFISACCPGWVRTDLAGDRAPLNPEQGAETPVFLALEDLKLLENGKFYKDKKVNSW